MKRYFLTVLVVILAMCFSQANALAILEDSNSDAILNSAAAEFGSLMASTDIYEDPTITGPDSITLYEGYSTAAVGPYTITGFYEPTVLVSSDIIAVWDHYSKSVFIAEGLPVGDYLVELTAQEQIMILQNTDIAVSNKMTLTVTVIPKSIDTGALKITGITSMLLTVGYAPTSTSPYFVTGNQPPVAYITDGVTATSTPIVTITSDTTAITWNENTQRLDIAAGLWAGSYTVVLTASNGVDPDARLFFTLTVLTRNGHGDGYGGSLDSNSGCNASYGYLALALLAIPIGLRRKLK